MQCFDGFPFEIAVSTWKPFSGTVFLEVLQCWGPAEMAGNDSSISQQDAAEFIQHWLQLLKSDAFDMRWEKRLQTAEGVRIMDHHSAYTPICFKFEPSHLSMPHIDLTALGTAWHQVDGMCTGLIQASVCLCIHLDRYLQGPNGLSKCTNSLTHDTEVMLPIFTSEQTDFDHVGYTIVALMAHQGSDAAGHYRTALKVTPHIMAKTHPVNWLLLDDWRSPEPIWALPTWFEQSVTVAWLIRTDMVRLHMYQTPDVQQSRMDLWKMLAATNADAQK